MGHKLNTFKCHSPASHLDSVCRRTWVEIDCSAIRHNLLVAKKRMPDAGVIAIVKANAYGHGIEEVSKAIASDVNYFAVASCEEALRIRSVVKNVSIMLLSAALPSEYPTIVKHRFIPIVSSFEEAKSFAKVAPKGAPIHVMIDTGMGRLGIAFEKAVHTVEQIAKLPLTIQSLSTHLPSADEDIEGTRAQLAAFKKIILELRTIAPHAEIHALNSAGVLRFSKETHCLIRVGLMLYGISPIPNFQKMLKPVMSWKARVALIQKLSKGATISYGKTYTAPRDLTVAILPLGYADGYPWQLSNKGVYVLINGRRCPLLGRVTMDQMIVDVSRAGDVRPGEEVVLIGRQKNQEIRPTWLSGKAGTIAWDLLTGIGERVERCYFE